MSLLLTGYSGFVGKLILSTLKEININVKLLGRSFVNNSPAVTYCNGVIGPNEEFNEALVGVSIIVHCAARAHIMNDASSHPLEAFREVNTYGTLNLAQQAANAGVKRFIFISSIKVNGETSELSKPFKPDDNYIPSDPYGLSKYEAEIGLRKIAKETGMEVVIIRPPLIYGPGVKANFASMMKWVNKGLPLPLGGINKNKRSLVSIYNLVDLIITCIDHPKAANQIFLVSDNEDVSTTGLLKNMAIALDTNHCLIPIPASWFNTASQLIGKPAIAQRLCGSLQVDISKTMELLDWKPPYASIESMKKTANAFLETLNKKKL